eukprot:TRINITY_DN63657_c0_g1_i1.p2 TRINITY_DN63657_c0_g1~~TRINITY_DN63657_c0_g1_i1.p2  ORF type:complete len:112 (+),score=5.43 TRINITY_DN63657_c0_g1_i1:45-380(+)
MILLGCALFPYFTKFFFPSLKAVLLFNCAIFFTYYTRNLTCCHSCKNGKDWTFPVCNCVSGYKIFDFIDKIKTFLKASQPLLLSVFAVSSTTKAASKSSIAMATMLLYTQF